ncbi:hypothetical protein H9P43_003968 [Blastocladiella emersonii ATCC 22665]|nr:hypothetical protein H9P43_003968 [Blastocladiella emersonii ATCC 22665]
MKGFLGRFKAKPTATEAPAAAAAVDPLAAVDPAPSSPAAAAPAGAQLATVGALPSLSNWGEFDDSLKGVPSAAQVASLPPLDGFGADDGALVAASPSSSGNHAAAAVESPPHVLNSIDFNRGTVHEAMTSALARTEALVAPLADRDPIGIQSVADMIADDFRSNFVRAFPGQPEPPAVDVSTGDARTTVVAEIHRAVFDVLADTFHRGDDGRPLTRDAATALYRDFMYSEQRGIGHRDLPAERGLLRDELAVAVQDVLGARGLAGNNDADMSPSDINRLRAAVSGLVMAFACVFIVHPLYRLDWLAPNTRFDEHTAQPPVRWLSSRRQPKKIETARIACVVLPRVDGSKTENPDDCPFRAVVVTYPADGIDGEPVCVGPNGGIADAVSAAVAVEATPAVAEVVQEVAAHEPEVYDDGGEEPATDSAADLDPAAPARIDRLTDVVDALEQYAHEYVDENEHDEDDEPAAVESSGSYADHLAAMGAADVAYPSVLSLGASAPAPAPAAPALPTITTTTVPATVAPPELPQLDPLALPPPPPRKASFDAANARQFPPRSSSIGKKDLPPLPPQH